ncbi:MAG: hypothetical protein NTZ05_10495 [Chloroflexi bacterium]|nr:hypothetical protein [Chloroflexota bacterium]
MLSKLTNPRGRLFGLVAVAVAVIGVGVILGALPADTPGTLSGCVECGVNIGGTATPAPRESVSLPIGDEPITVLFTPTPSPNKVRLWRTQGSSQVRGDEVPDFTKIPLPTGGTMNSDNTTVAVEIEYGGNAAVYDQPNYRGNCTYINTPGRVELAGTPLGVNAASSIRMGPNVKGCDGLQLFANNYFAGAVVTIEIPGSTGAMTTGFSALAPQLSAKGFDNRASSARILGNPVQGRPWGLYDSDSFKGQCSLVRWDVDSFAALFIGHDRASSVLPSDIKCGGPNPAPEAIVLFDNANFTGSPLSIDNSVEDLSYANYHVRLSSISIPAGYSNVKLYTAPGFHGTCMNAPGQLTQLPPHMNNNVFSIIVGGAPCLP